MQKLKCQYFGHVMQRTDSLEKILMLGKIEGRKRKGHPSMRWLDAITDCIDMSKLLELTQTYVQRVGDAIQPSHPLSFPSPAFNLSQHQGLF